MPDYEKIRAAQIAELKDSLSRAQESHSIFLAGPYIRPDQSDTHPENSKSEACKLRYFLYHQFTDGATKVYLGEDDALRRNGSKNYGALSNAAIYERHYIVNYTDALIIFPSSPGSFCELGDWAPSPDIAKKMYIIVDQKYAGQPSYVNNGVLALASLQGARVDYISYTDRDDILQSCQAFLQETEARMRIERLYGRK